MIYRRFLGEPFVFTLVECPDEGQWRTKFDRVPALGKLDALWCRLVENPKWYRRRPWPLSVFDRPEREALMLHRSVDEAAKIYVFVHKGDAEFVRAMHKFVTALRKLRGAKHIEVLIPPQVFSVPPVEAWKKQLEGKGVTFSEYRSDAKNYRSPVGGKEARDGKAELSEIFSPYSRKGR